MRTKRLLPVLLLLVVCGAATAQSNDELPALDDDNQFPPENPSGPDVDAVMEGSGAGVLEGPLDSVTESLSQAILEDAEPTAEPAPADQLLCPETCTCSAEGEGDSYGYTVNCANKDLQEFPSNIDLKTTELYLQNNQVTELPKSLSDLKSLRVLNANDNSIMDITSGTISELPALKVLKLRNNRLLDYPQDLKNSFSLENLEEIDISGNDIRSSLTVENFSNFVALKKATLPESGDEIKEALCNTLKNSLETICIESCDQKEFVCSDVPQNIAGEFLEAKLPGTIALSNTILDNADPNVEIADDGSTTTETQQSTQTPDTDTTKDDSATTPGDANLAAGDFSLRSAVINPETSESDGGPVNVFMQNPVDTPEETDVKIGATTSDTKTGGVDKSVIGIVVAGMILIVAGITIKKNWSSLRKRFSSSPRPANGVTSNGTAPEEVPLQENDKLPV